MYIVHIFLDRSERPDVRYPVHLQRAAGLPRLLANLLHHGRPVLRGQVLQVCRQVGEVNQSNISLSNQSIKLFIIQSNNQPINQSIEITNSFTYQINC